MGQSAEQMRKEIEALHRARQSESDAMIVPIAPVSGKAGEILQRLYKGEPVFILRAKDVLSSFALEAYLTMIEKFDPTGEQAESLVHIIQEFRTWQRTNPDLIKLPD